MIHLRLSVSTAIAVLFYLFAAAVGAQESGPDGLPPVTRQYQQRFDAVRSGAPLPLFHGSASVLPGRAQSFLASIGLAGVPQQLGHFCAATAIAPHWALTAAHCVNTTSEEAGEAQIMPLEPAKLQVLVGTNTLHAGGQVKPISRIVIHPNFDVTAAGVPVNDLALLQFTDTVASKPAPLASEALAAIAIRPGDRVLIAGWGSASFDAGSPISDNLLFATVPVVDHTKCNEAYHGAVTEQMFCAGLGSADSCQGDSGGPAFVFDQQGTPTLIGVVSWGAGCTKKRYPGVYVNIVKYRGWIDATIGGQQAAQ